MVKGRDEFFDFIKGYAIWVVAMGHTVQACVPDWSESVLGRAIVMFFMPLFMVVSGYFFYPSVTRRACGEFIRGKFVHLYLPSLCWGVFSALLIGGNKIMNGKELDPEYFVVLITTGLWFLTVLFMLSVTGALIERFFKGKAVAAAWVVAYAVVYVTPPLPHNFLCMNELEFLLPFFCGGMVFRRFDWSKCPAWLFVLSCAVFVYLLMDVYTFDCSVYKMDGATFTADYAWKTMVRIVSGASGIVCSVYVCVWLYKARALRRPVIYIGMLTLPIYALHQKFLTPTRLFDYKTDNILLIFAVSIVIILLSVGTYKVLRNKYIRLLFFGERIERAG